MKDLIDLPRLPPFPPLRDARSRYAEMKEKIEREYGETIPPPPRELYHVEHYHNLEHLDKVIMLFWWCKEKSKIHDGVWDWFDFDKAYDLVETPIREKLGQHNMLPDDKQVEYYHEKTDYFLAQQLQMLIGGGVMGKMSTKQGIEVYEEVNDYWRDLQRRSGDPEIIDIDRYAEISGYEHWATSKFLKDVIFDNYTFKDTLIKAVAPKDVFQQLSELQTIKRTYNELRKDRPEEIGYKVALFDRIIDMYHHTGHVFDRYINIEKLREKFEENYM